MSLAVGIVGLPNVGKSTLFNALTKNSVDAENYPFCTIDPSVGVVSVPDERLFKLSTLSKSEKTLPAVVEFVDIAGLVRGASAGEGLGNQFLSNIREVDMIAEVVRLFEDPDIVHVAGEVDPLGDIEVINLELILADLQTVSKRLSNIEREVKKHDKDALKEQDVLTRLQKTLEEGKLARSLEVQDDESLYVRNLHLLTSKKILYVLNKKSGGHNIDEINDERWQKLETFLKSSGSEWVFVDAGVENDIKDLADTDKDGFRQEFGCLEDGIISLIQKSYRLLDLITYFTTGETETRAWTVLRDSTAPQAGAAIHTDFQTKFIRADVIESDKLLEAGSYAAAREKGWVRTEGKEYVVQDGDVIEFRI